MRLIMSADWHLGSYRGPDNNGVNGRLLDIQEKIQEILDYIQEQDVLHTLIIGGDLFRDKQPAMLHLEILSKFLNKCETHKIPTRIIPGNHDVNRIKGSAHALSPFMPLLSSSKYVKIIDKPWIEEFNEGEIFYFPYMSTPQEPKIKEFLKDATKRDILVMHGMIGGAQLNPMFEYEVPDDDSISTEVLSKVGTVLAGDIHMAQHFKNVWYPGSIERLDFGDEFTNKGFLDVDWSGEKVDVKTIPLNARKMLTIDFNQLKEVEAGRVNIEGGIIRVVGADRGYIEDTKRILTNKGCYFVAGIHTHSQTIQEAPKKVGIDVSDFVRMYAEKKEYKGDIQSASQTVVDLLNAQA